MSEQSRAARIRTNETRPLTTDHCMTTRPATSPVLLTEATMLLRSSSSLGVHVVCLFLNMVSFVVCSTASPCRPTSICPTTPSLIPPPPVSKLSSVAFGHVGGPESAGVDSSPLLVAICPCETKCIRLLFHLFLTSLSVRPGSSNAMLAHLFPIAFCALMIFSSSSAVHNTAQKHTSHVCQVLSDPVGTISPRAHNCEGAQTMGYRFSCGCQQSYSNIARGIACLCAAGQSSAPASSWTPSACGAHE